MHAGETSGPDEATKERLMANTQRLLHDIVNKRKQKEEMLPIKPYITGGDSGSTKRSFADKGIKGNAVEEDMKRLEVGATKYKVPGVIKMRMSGFSALEKFKSINGSKVEAEKSGRGLKRRIGGEVKGGSANKRSKLSMSRSVEGVTDPAVPKKSGVKVASTSQSKGDSGLGATKNVKQPLGSVGSAKKQSRVEMNINKGKEGKVKGPGFTKDVAGGKARKAGRPRSNRFPPTKQILGETPRGDQTW